MRPIRFCNIIGTSTESLRFEVKLSMEQMNLEISQLYYSPNVLMILEFLCSYTNEIATLCYSL